jgi:hypothetical protein
MLTGPVTILASSVGWCRAIDTSGRDAVTAPG